ncbi:MAG: aquaporin [Candidatus Gracilibacteria bacterium]
MQETWQKYVAEFIATFAFVFICAGAALANWQTGGALGAFGMAAASGLMLTAMYYGIYKISGGHLNPAVTIALFATGHIKAAVAGGYIVAQLLGSTLAALFLKIIFADVSPKFYLGDVAVSSGVSPWMAILIEAVLAFMLVWTYFATIVDKKQESQLGGVMIGIVLAVSIMIAGHLTSGALNPARSFGPALISSHWENHYVYWVGPIVGALMAAFVYSFGFMKKHLG